MVTGHVGHELVPTVGRGRLGEMFGWLICATCSVIVRRLPVCGSPTRLGRTCRRPVRVDLGDTNCRDHGGARAAAPLPRRAS
jgi:hypothetical protein